MQGWAGDEDPVACSMVELTLLADDHPSGIIRGGLVIKTGGHNPTPSCAPW